MSTPEFVFEDLLKEYTQYQLKRTKEGQDNLRYLNENFREPLFERLKFAVEGSNNTKVFDRYSLMQMEEFFKIADGIYNSTAQSDFNQPWYGADAEVWFKENYRFMFEPVSMLEFIRFYGGGKSFNEKEVIFRSMVSKLIKTQETIRKICLKKGFLESFLERHPAVGETYPAHIAKMARLKKIPDAKNAIIHGLQFMVNEIGEHSIRIFKHLNIELNGKAQVAFNRRRLYEALVLMMRYSEEELFKDLNNDEYMILTEDLRDVMRVTMFHPEVSMYQAIKRAFLTDWVVNSLRNQEREQPFLYMQSGKAKLYKEFNGINLNEEQLKQLASKEDLDNPQVIEMETQALEALASDKFYELLFNIYRKYREEDLKGDALSLHPTVMASQGNIKFDKMNMMAWLEKKVQMIQKEGGKPNVSMRSFATMLNSMKQATKTFVNTNKKMAVVEKRRQEMQSIFVEPEPEPPPLPQMEYAFKDDPLPVCFPSSKTDVRTYNKGQRQDYTFNNSDSVATFHPLEQEFIVDFFNVHGVGNDPLNPGYQLFARFVQRILSHFDEKVRTAQKQYTLKVQLPPFEERVVYLRTDDNIIVSLGETEMGQSKKLGDLPFRKTHYWRLFVKGPYLRMLPQTWAMSVVKDFPVDGVHIKFKEVTLPDHYENALTLQGLVIDSFMTILEHVPNETFMTLSGGHQSLIDLFQSKARGLIEKGVKMKHAKPQEAKEQEKKD